MLFVYGKMAALFTTVLSSRVSSVGIRMASRVSVMAMVRVSVK